MSILTDTQLPISHATAEGAVQLPSLKGQRILITGGLGFIGSNLAHACLSAGARVTIYDCLDPHSGGNMRNVREIEDSVEIVLNDIRNLEGIYACIRNKDILFSCAAFTSHPNSMKEPFLDIDVNCKGVINILEAARRFNPDVKIVHVGTSTQVGRMHGVQIDEFHPEFPVDIYSANKSASEKYVLIYGKAYRMQTSVVRLANVFGPRSNIKSPDFGFMNYFIGLALQNKSITVFGDGSQLRNISFVDDCVRALILTALSERANGQVFFATSDSQCTVAEVAQQITHVIGGHLKFQEWPPDRRVIEIGDAVINSGRIHDALGWRAESSLGSGLRRTREYFESCLDYYLR